MFVQNVSFFGIRWGFKARSLIGYMQFLQKFNIIKTGGVYALPYQSTHWYVDRNIIIL